MPIKKLSQTEYDEMIAFKDGQIKLAFWFAIFVGVILGIVIGKWIL